MTRELGKNRERIIAFLQELNDAEKLMVLDYLADDRSISFLLPDEGRGPCRAPSLAEAPKQAFETTR